MSKKDIAEFSFSDQINVTVSDATYNVQTEDKNITIPVSKYDELYRQQGLYFAEQTRATSAEKENALLRNEILSLQEQLQNSYEKIKNLKQGL